MMSAPEVIWRVSEKLLPDRTWHLAEPATVITDYLIAAACAFFAWSLTTRGAPGEWLLGFMLGGASALAGGTYHGLRERLSARTGAALWFSTLLCFGASAAAFGVGAVLIARPELNHLTVQLAALTAFGVYAVAALHHPLFSTASRLALLMLVTFMAMALSLALRGEAKPAALMLACVALNAGGVVVQMRNLSPHPSFNHNDVFHVLQLAALGCLYAAVGAV